MVDIVQEILGTLRLSIPEAINLFFKQVELNQGLPFEVKIPINVKKIRPSKISDIKKILAVIPNSLEELWIFGSTVTQYCRPQSDIDICLIVHTTTIEEQLILRAPHKRR